MPSLLLTLMRVRLISGESMSWSLAVRIGKAMIVPKGGQASRVRGGQNQTAVQRELLTKRIRTVILILVFVIRRVVTKGVGCIAVAVIVAKWVLAIIIFAKGTCFADR